MPSTASSARRLVLSIASLLLPAVTLGQSTSAPRSERALTPAELTQTQSKLNPQLVPDLVGPLQAEDTQSFAVRLQDGSSVWMRPVRYYSRDTSTGGTSTRCGVFFLRANVPAVFLKTVGYDWTEAEHCNALQAVGFSGSSGQSPQILLLYAAASPNTPVSEPFVLVWNPADARYQINEALSKKLEDDAGAISIQGMKRALRGYGTTR